MLDLDKIIEDMGGPEKLIKFLPMSVEKLEPYIKAKTLDQVIPGEFWVLKLGFHGNGVSTFYRTRTDPPFPKELSISEMIQVVKRVAHILVEKKNEKRKLALTKPHK